MPRGNSRFVRALSLLASGALVMYFFDPRLGHRRRLLLRDRSRAAVKSAARQSRRMARDFAYRSRGMMHRLGDRILPSQHASPDHEVLLARVCSRIGRAMDIEPQSFHVEAHDGKITLVGEVPDTLYQRLNPIIRHVPGVRQVCREHATIRPKKAV